MKASGNGRPEQCVSNLLKLFQYEVPFARLKGMDPTIIDSPGNEAISKTKNHAAWLIGNYEPRVTLNDLEVTFDDNGKISVNPDITINEL